MKTTIIPLIPLLSLIGCKSGQSEQKPLNIVYIMSDDHAFRAISCYDNRYISTPNIDRLAAEGVRFTNSFVCNSISSPSRAAMLTGKHSHINGKIDNLSSFDNTQQTYPKLLQEAGYETAIIGKWHLDSEPTGFNHWTILPGQGDYYNPEFIDSTGTYQVEGYATDLITDMSIKWIDSITDTGKPFALLLHHKAPHRNWMANLNDINLFEDVEFPLPANFWDEYENRPAAAAQEMSIHTGDMDLLYDLKMKDPSIPSRFGDKLNSYERMTPEQKAAWDAHYNPIIEDFKKQNLSGKELAQWKYQRYMRDYLKVIKSVDDNIGRVYNYLKEKGLLENTIIVYTSDQGFYMGEHGWFDKRFMYEESFRTPLVMRLPEHLAKRGNIPQLVQNIDYAPTFLELAGVVVPEDIQGVSLVPLLKGEPTPEWRKSLYYHFYEYPGEHAVRRHYGVRTDRFKLIHFYGDIDSWELYDIQSDPSEMNNLANNPSYAAMLLELQQELKRLQIQYNDPIDK